MVAPRAAAGSARVEGVGGPQQVVGDHRAQRPGVVGRESAGGQVRQGPVDQVGEHGFDDCVLTVGQVSLRGRLGAVGEERVVAPDGEQLGQLGLVADPAHDQPGGDRVLGGGERGEGGLGDLRVGDQLCRCPGRARRPGIAPGSTPSSGMALIAAATLRFLVSTTEKPTFAFRQAPTTSLVP